MKDYLVYPDAVKQLNTQQKGRLAETIAKTVFLANGFDVFEPECDDKGVDLLIQLPGSEKAYEVQVKGITGDNYTFLREKFIDERAKDLRYVCYIRLDCDPEPDVFLIPLKAWDDQSPILKIRKYDKPGQISEPEYGICYSKKNAELFDEFRIQTMLKELLPTSDSAN